MHRSDQAGLLAEGNLRESIQRIYDSEALVLVSSQRRQNFVQSRHSELWDHDCLVDRLTLGPDKGES